MTVREGLRALDERLLGRFARGLRSGLEYVPGYQPPPAPTWGELRRRERPVGPATFILTLRDIDDRFANRGMLAFLREVPQLGGFLIALMLLTAGGTVLRRDPRNATSRDTVRVEGGKQCQPTTFGDFADVAPPIGQKVTTFVSSAKLRLARAAKGCTTDRRYAVVSFKRYSTPDDVARLLRDVIPVASFWRVPNGGTPMDAMSTDPITSFRTDTVRDFHALAKRLLIDANVNTGPEVQSLKNSPRKNDRIQYQFDIKLAAAERAQAKALQQNCACVFAVAVEGPVGRLAALAKLPLVRVVDAAPPGADRDQVQFRGLLPEEVKVITGGNEQPRG